MDCSMPGCPVLHQISELAQTQVHQVSDAIQPSHPLSSPFPQAVNHSSFRVFSSEWVLSIRWPKYWSFSFIISPPVNIQDWFPFISDFSQPHGLQHTRPPYPSPTPGVYSNSSPLSRWCHPTISSSVIPFFSHLQSFPASESFQTSQLFPSGGQSIKVSASTSVLPMNTQDWSPLGWTVWISLQSKGLSRVFSKTTVQKHQFISTQLSSQSNSHSHTWPLEKP